jgi:tRNA 2-thiocytidine biosynthesis protein TtcA
MIPADDRKQRLEFNKLQKRLRRNVGKAIADYQMIEDGDRIMVCLSGGKDSFAMLDILIGLQKTAPIEFELVAVNMDQKQPGFPEHVLPAYLEAIGLPFHIIEKDTYSVVKEKVPEGKTTCGLCSRLRRGTLYAFAESIGATKIALGHHKDDIVETLFLNMFYGSRLKAMPPKLLSDDQRNVVIRPLAYCRESDLAKFAEHRQFPGRSDSIFKSLQNISPSQLADRALYDFGSLAIDRSGERAAYAFADTESSRSYPQPEAIDVMNL